MASRNVTLYIDYKSPYAYLVKEPAYALEREFGIEFTWLPYVLNIPDFLGTVEDRNPHQWRRVRYSYMDARPSEQQQHGSPGTREWWSIQALAPSLRN